MVYVVLKLIELTRTTSTNFKCSTTVYLKYVPYTRIRKSVTFTGKYKIQDDIYYPKTY